MGKISVTDYEAVILKKKLKKTIAGGVFKGSFG